MKSAIRHIILLYTVVIVLFSSCEKEISVNLPSGKKSLVVEASINQTFTNLNYVFITRTIDYFNPDLSLYGVGNATVYITPGTINGKDTSFNQADRVQLTSITTLPGATQFLNGISGIYFNPFFTAQIGIPYLLEIDVDGEKVTGKTTIPPVILIDTLYYREEIDTHRKDTNMFVTFEFKDGPEQNNYRLFGYRSSNQYLIGWGTADFARLLDDQILNNGVRPYAFLNPFKYSDTLNLYLTSIGRTEYLFWQSYRKAANNGGPYSTPMTVQSNLTGAIGSFTGYGVSYKRVILR